MDISDRRDAEPGHTEPPEPELGPRAPDPTPDVDGVLGPTDAPRELLVGFWSLVILFNLGLFGLSLGAMLIWFRGSWDVGGALLVLGLLATVHGIHRYRVLRERDDLWED